MQIELKDYQTDAVREILTKLGTARQLWELTRGISTPVRSSLALSSVTGSGKTVIAAAVIEAILHGSDEFDIDPVPGAVVLWVSKDPSLNEQTRSRIISVADRIPVGDFEILDSESFNGESLRAGAVYFINPDKLREGGKFLTRSDTRQTTFWEILENTISDPQKTLYMVLDEAHEGTKAVSKDSVAADQSIVLKLINGTGVNPAMPIVWGISATPKRFTDAMERAENRTPQGIIEIDPRRVQASGLLKNTLVLDIPDEDGDFETTMIRDAATDFQQVCERWDDYTTAEGINPIFPLLIVQIPNRDDGVSSTAEEDRIIREALDVVRINWTGFTDDCVAHVLGDRSTIDVGGYEIPKVPSQDIQADNRIRVLIAKDAISTGWDCPRAEVLVSLRSTRRSHNETYVTQLLGRMVRTPLAESTSDDRLNSVSCYLPRFNKETAKKVAEVIMGERDLGTNAGRDAVGPKVLFKPVDLEWNELVPREASNVIEALPSFPKPALAPKPIKRLLKAAQAFAQDGIVSDANKIAHETIYAKLDGIAAEYAAELKAKTADLLTAEIRRIRVDRGGETVEEALERDADINTVKDALRYIRRLISASIANGYLRREAEAALQNNVLQADLTFVRARVASLALIDTKPSDPSVVEMVESAADSLVKTWLTTHRDTIALLPDTRRNTYEEIRALAREPEDTPTEIPEVLRVDSVDSDLKPLPTAMKHILSDPNGVFWLDARTNPDERTVIERECGRESVVGWYRNPSQSSRAALRVPYKRDGQWAAMQPDFVFVQVNAEGALVPSIVDPHGTYFADALPRLVGLANYAEQFGGRYARIESLANVDGTLRMLDMKNSDVRTAIWAAASSPGATASTVFKSEVAVVY